MSIAREIWRPIRPPFTDIDQRIDGYIPTLTNKPDWSSGTDSWGGVKTTRLGGQTLAGKINVLTATVDGTAGTHTIQKAILTVGKTYLVRGYVYIPSANALGDTLRIASSGGNMFYNYGGSEPPTPDTWFYFEHEKKITSGTSLVFFLMDGGVTSWTGNSSDTFSLAEVEIWEVDDR